MMLSKSFALISLALASFAAANPLEKRATVPGIDVSGWQTSVNWKTVKANGVKWAYIKATEGTGYHSPEFTSQYNGCTANGIIRGAYHFARPDLSGGAAQATYFATHGGGWSADGRTLPGAIDMEYAPSGNSCYGKTHAQMVAWIKDFSDTYHKKTKRYPTIYTNLDWWTTCTGNSKAFAKTNPLWVARWSSTIGTLPGGWSKAHFWQYANHGANPGDADRWQGDLTSLKAFTKSG